MEELGSPLKPVAAIGPARLALDGGAEMPLFANRADWRAPDAGLRHAVITIHGRQRNADDYFADTVAVAQGDDALIIAPQFVTLLDTAAHGAPANLLRWSESEWMGGDPATAPAPISGFAVLDALLEVLGDRSRFPALETIVVAGHSGGGQVVQRYALLTPREDIRFIIANPSSYAYLSPERPTAAGGFAPPDAAAFPGYDSWKYGLRTRPAYAADIADLALEPRYIARDITYVLGQADCDPEHPALDRSRAAAAQGPNRLARGRGFFAYLQARHGAALKHRLIEIPGVGHNPSGIFSDPRVRKLLFNK